MIGTELYTQAYDDFVASLDISTRDAVTKLMIHTKTRPDDPQMVGVCLTAVATRRSAMTQARVLEALETLNRGPEMERGLYRVSILKESLDRFEDFFRNCIAISGIAAGLLGILWLATMFWAWQDGYAWARNDIHAATHEQVCNDINGYIAQTSSYWRNSLGMTAAADRLAKTEFKDCPR